MPTTVLIGKILSIRALILGEKQFLLFLENTKDLSLSIMCSKGCSHIYKSFKKFLSPNSYYKTL